MKTSNKVLLIVTSATSEWLSDKFLIYAQGHLQGILEKLESYEDIEAKIFEILYILNL